MDSNIGHLSKRTVRDTQDGCSVVKGYKHARSMPLTQADVLGQIDKAKNMAKQLGMPILFASVPVEGDERGCWVLCSDENDLNELTQTALLGVLGFIKPEDREEFLRVVGYEALQSLYDRESKEAA